MKLVKWIDDQNKTKEKYLYCDSPLVCTGESYPNANILVSVEIVLNKHIKHHLK